MATVFESSFLSNRVHRIEERYEESTNTFGKCDCTSYSYLALSVILFMIGTAITIFSLDDIVGEHIFFKLGHMWLIGPIFICSGLMVAVKCMLYLRRKSVIQMIFHQRQLFRELSGTRGIERIDIQTPGPPSYEAIAQESCNELPPPSYAEAVALIRKTIGSNTKSNSATVSCDSIAIDQNVRCKP
ncbi:uncharacterized protein LOC100868353 isoform X2 [Apis florea]|uniref:Uncharacterized protein LOC100577594 isoform X2 n=1 Tax=Apis mellifera TaxID=7460 RepID=A0A7M7GAX1_APIME|nr:uncharacterized protein LOC100577594 isoform X2 [Apis mellifera]XP_012348614.1 uncharacterized protein LOC100868353 isoform X2 [Apis florea]|eukprot:XP_003251929.1 uncharacterized protein LOC100577594 isoform X2 [Apis mellifera]